MSFTVLRLCDFREGGNGELTVAEVIDAYLRRLKARVVADDYSEDGYDDAMRDLLRFASAFGAQTMDQCRQHDISGWLDLNPQFKSNHTKKRILGIILRAFTWAEEEELIDSCPYRKVKGKLVTKPRRAAEESEYVRLMRCRSRPLRRALFFLRRSGARTCEMRELLWPHVDLAGGFIRMEKHKASRLSEDCSPRIIGLESVLLRFLRNLHRKRPDGIDHVFLNCDGMPWKNRHVFNRHFRRHADRLGIARDLTPYCFRHLWTTTAVLAGLGERQIADQLGHSGTRLVSWYSHTAKKEKHLSQVAAAAMERDRKRGGKHHG